MRRTGGQWSDVWSMEKQNTCLCAEPVQYYTAYPGNKDRKRCRVDIYQLSSIICLSFWTFQTFLGTATFWRYCQGTWWNIQFYAQYVWILIKKNIQFLTLVIKGCWWLSAVGHCQTQTSVHFLRQCSCGPLFVFDTLCLLYNPNSHGNSPGAENNLSLDKLCSPPAGLEGPH